MESENKNKTDISKLNIYQRLAEVRRIADFVQKQDLRSEATLKRGDKGLGYKAVSSAIVLLKVNKAINDHGLFLTTEIKDKVISINQFVNSFGKDTRQWRADLTTKMTWVNIDNTDEKIVSDWYCSATNSSLPMAIGAALTYAEKYYILKFFSIPTDELDPDVLAQNENKKDDVLDLKQDNNSVEPLQRLMISALSNKNTLSEFNTSVSTFKKINNLAGDELGFKDTYWRLYNEVQEKEAINDVDSCDKLDGLRIIREKYTKSENFMKNYKRVLSEKIKLLASKKTDVVLMDEVLQEAKIIN